MHRYQVFYSELPEGGAGFQPVFAVDAYEARQIVERQHPGAVLASLDGELMDAITVRQLFLDWLGKV